MLRRLTAALGRVVSPADSPAGAGRLGRVVDPPGHTAAVEPPCPHARRILSTVFDRVEAATLGRDPAARPDRSGPAPARTPELGEWPFDGVVMLSGPTDAMRAVAATLIVAAADAGDEVVVQGRDEDLVGLFEVALAQQGPPLDRMRSGMMAAADWAPMSRAMGALARRVVVTPTVSSVGVWASGKGLLLVGDDMGGTVPVSADQDGLRVGGVRIGEWDQDTGRVRR